MADLKQVSIKTLKATAAVNDRLARLEAVLGITVDETGKSHMPEPLDIRLGRLEGKLDALAAAPRGPSPSPGNTPKKER